MIDVVNLKEMPQGIMEIGGRIEILSRKNMLSGILPEPFNNIEVRGIWRQEYEVDSPLGRNPQKVGQPPIILEDYIKLSSEEIAGESIIGDC